MSLSPAPNLTHNAKCPLLPLQSRCSSDTAFVSCSDKCTGLLISHSTTLRHIRHSPSHLACHVLFRTHQQYSLPALQSPKALSLAGHLCERIQDLVKPARPHFSEGPLLAESSWESDFPALGLHPKMGINLDAVGLCGHLMRVNGGAWDHCVAYSRHPTRDSHLSAYDMPPSCLFLACLRPHPYPTQLSSQLSSPHRTQDIWSWKRTRLSSSLEPAQEFLSPSQPHLLVETTWDSALRVIPAKWVPFNAVIDSFVSGEERVGSK